MSELSRYDRALAEKLAIQLAHEGLTEIPAGFDDVQERSEWSFDHGDKASGHWSRVQQYQAADWPAVKMIALRLATDPTWVERNA